MIEWNIQARAHQCQSCGHSFAPKESFHTLLFDQKHSFERLDLCQSCWNQSYKQETSQRQDLISHWQGVYTPPPAAPPEAIQKQTADSLLRQLVERNQPEHAAARFILAAMLERKRLLRVKAQLREEGQRVFIYEHVNSGDLLRIVDPELKLDQLEDVQRSVALLLEHGLPEESSNQAHDSPSPPNPVDTVQATSEPEVEPVCAGQPSQ